MKKICTHEGFDIYFQAQKEHTTLREHFVRECGWSKEAYKNLKDTEPAWFCAHVVAKKEGVILGEDYLGCCCYESVEEFYTKYFDDYFKSMILNCIEQASKTLPKIIRGLEVKRDGLTKTIAALKESENV